MFKKKNKKQKQTNFEDEIIVATSEEKSDSLMETFIKVEDTKENSDVEIDNEIYDDVEIEETMLDENAESLMKGLIKSQEIKDEDEEIEEILEEQDKKISDEKDKLARMSIIKDIEIADKDSEIEKEETEELIVGSFTFYDNDPNTECAVDETSSDDESIEEQDESEDNKDKKELDSYFEKSKKNNKDIKEKPIKEKRKSRRKLSKETEFSNIKDQKIFVFRNKKYSKVEDFINYLNNHYLEIDVISQEVLDNENFYGWISKKSGVFDDSIKEFKEIKEKIEKK